VFIAATRVVAGLTVEPNVSIGDLLTAGTVLISALALFASWRSERKARDRERANEVRAAATATVAKLERWQQLADFYYVSIQPLFVTISDMLSPETVSRTQKLEEARDALWRELTEARTASQQRILEENIELAYVGLQAYDQTAYASVVKLVADLRHIDEEVYAEFVTKGAQRAVSHADKYGAKYHPALLG
jgi:hypothetical protein